MKDNCPYCKSPVKHKGRIEVSHGSPREYPTTFECGTVTSPNWNPPIKGAYCNELMNKTIPFNFENERWFFDASTNRFIGPRRNITSHHPIFCRLEAALKAQQPAAQPQAAALEVGAL